MADGDIAQERQADRLKAEMLLLQSKKDISIVGFAEVLGEVPHSPQRSESMMSESTGSLMPGETYASTEDEGEAKTPDMVAADVIAPGQGKDKGGQAHEAVSPSASMPI